MFLELKGVIDIKESTVTTTYKDFSELIPVEIISKLKIQIDNLSIS